MSTLRRIASALAVAALIALPAHPAYAEPTPSPSAPPCKSGSMKFTLPTDIAVASAPDVWLTRSGRIQDTVGYYYKDLAFTFAIWPDAGDLGVAPKVAWVTSSSRIALRLHRVSSPRPMYVVEGIKAPTIFPGGQNFVKFEVAFSASNVVTTYSTKLTATAAVCGATVLGSSTAMRFGFQTDQAGNPPTSATPKPSAPAKASAKSSAKPRTSPAPQASAPDEEVVGGEAAPGDSAVVADAANDLASGVQPEEDSGSPLPWLAGLGVTALVVAAGLLFWLRRSSAADEDY